MSTDKIKVKGFQTFWRMPSHFDRQVIYDALKELGWKGHCPRERTNASALKEAMTHLVQQWKFDNVMVRALEDTDENGWAVVRETPGAHENSYRTLFTVRWRQDSEESSPYVQVTSDTHTVDEGAINDWFHHFRGRITNGMVSKMLKVIIIYKLRGVALRETGGFYWLPSESAELYDKLRSAVEHAGDGYCKVYTPGFDLADVSAAEAVRDAIRDDIAARSAEIANSATRGERGEKALKARRTDAQQLHDRVAAYESYLGEALDDLHKVADQCESQVVDAAVQSFPSIFGFDDMVAQEMQNQEADENDVTETAELQTV